MQRTGNTLAAFRGSTTRSMSVSFHQQAEEMLDLIDNDNGREILNEVLAHMYDPSFSDEQFRELVVDAVQPYLDDYQEAFGD